MSGGGDKASKRAQQAEDQRRQAIASTQAAVNRVFNSPTREAEIGDFVGALRDKGLVDLDEQKGDTDRALKFALARGGLIGGSTQVDQQTDLSKAYQRGVLDIENRAQGAGSDLRASDQDARARLISLATQGLDTTTAAQQAAAAMRTNLESGRSTAMAQGIGDTFSSFKQFADRRRDEQSRRTALYDANRNLYGPSAATSYRYGGGS